ncbi:MAG: hypothetical protein AAFZ11_09310 [Pseudomonadota bacterium]
MKNLMRGLVFGAAMVAVSGCTTTLKSYPEPALTQRTQGIPYSLPETQVELAASWSVTDCSKLTYTYLMPAIPDGQSREYVVANTPVQQAKVKGLTSKPERFVRKFDGRLVLTDDNTFGDAPTVSDMDDLPLVELKPAATYSAKTIEGPTLILDYEELTEAFKTGSLTVEYHKGTQLLKSLNAKVDGQEVAALKAATGIFVSAAKIGLGLPSPSAAGMAGVESAGSPITPPAQEHCSANGIELVKARNQVLADIKGHEGTLATISSKIAEINLKIAKGGVDDAALTQLKKDLAAQNTSLKGVNTAIASLKTRLAILDEYLTVTSKAILTGTGKTIPTQIKLEPKQVDKFEDKVIKVDAFDAQDLVDGSALNITFAPVREPSTSCASTGNQGKVGCRLKLASEGAHSGLVYRSAVPSQLLVTTSNAVEPTKRTVLKATINVIQFGRVRELPLQNAFGESNALEALFDEQGLPTKIGYTKTKSGSLETLNALSDAAEKINALQAEIEADKKAKADALTAETETLAAKELTDLQRKRDLLKTQGEIDDLLDPETPDPTQIETLQAEADILELTLKIRQTEQAIEDLEDDD